MQPGTFQGNGRINRQYALQELGQYMPVHPFPQTISLLRITPLDAQNSDLKFQKGKNG